MLVDTGAKRPLSVYAVVAQLIASQPASPCIIGRQKWTSRELSLKAWLRLFSPHCWYPVVPGFAKHESGSSGEFWKITLGNDSPVRCAHTGSTVIRRPYGHSGPLLKSNRPGRLPSP